MDFTCINVNASLQSFWLWAWQKQFPSGLQHLLFAVTANPIDILKILELSEDMEGVSLEAGLCTSRTGRKETDLSFKINKKIQVSVPTKQLFPGEFVCLLYDLRACFREQM